MSALPKLEQIQSRPITRPIYAPELANFNAFVAANLEALRSWFTQLTAWTDHGMGWEEFCRIQYDIEVETHAQARSDRYARDRETRERFSNFDAQTGIRRHGEI